MHLTINHHTGHALKHISHNNALGISQNTHSHIHDCIGGHCRYNSDQACTMWHGQNYMEHVTGHVTFMHVQSGRHTRTDVHTYKYMGCIQWCMVSNLG